MSSWEDEIRRRETDKRLTVVRERYVAAFWVVHWVFGDTEGMRSCVAKAWATTTWGTCYGI